MKQISRVQAARDDRLATEPDRGLPPPASAVKSASDRRTPWVQLKYYSSAPTLYPAMVHSASPDARPGDLVSVYDKEGRAYGAGLYNPHARVPVRMFHHGEALFGEEDILRLLDRAVDLRQTVLRLPEVTEAYRVVHSDGDGLSGLIVDRYADTLSVSVHSLGVWQRLGRWLPHLHARLGTRREVVEVEDHIARLERIVRRGPEPAPMSPAKIREHGVRYEVDFIAGHKTGFFCDQRENRRRLAGWVRAESRVLDLCCYTGGFALAAAVLGHAGEVTGVDLDEHAIARAKRNANLNGMRIDWVHCDAYSYARQMQRNGRSWDVVVLDPPKLVERRDDAREGQMRYEDLNGLAMRLLPPGGLLVTCSCSGLVTEGDFEQFVIRAARRVERRVQFLDRTGAGPDHPVMANCPESRYLKVFWVRVL